MRPIFGQGVIKWSQNPGGSLRWRDGHFPGDARRTDGNGRFRKFLGSFQIVDLNIPCCNVVMETHPEFGPVTTVRHVFIRAGKNAGNFVSDLIFIRGVPTIVIEWLESPDGVSCPLLTISLDPRHLHKIESPEADFLQADYLYEVEVIDPRRFG